MQIRDFEFLLSCQVVNGNGNAVMSTVRCPLQIIEAALHVMGVGHKVTTDHDQVLSRLVSKGDWRARSSLSGDCTVCQVIPIEPSCNRPSNHNRPSNQHQGLISLRSEQVQFVCGEPGFCDTNGSIIWNSTWQSARQCRDISNGKKD